MDLNNIVAAFGNRIVGGMIPQTIDDGSCYDYNCFMGYVTQCYTPFDCNVYECLIFDCSQSFTGCGFSCPNKGGGNDFTCYTYTLRPGCSGPVSVPCGG